MPAFYALVDAVPGQEEKVLAWLRSDAHVQGVVPCKHGNHDFLVRIEAASFDVVDDILRTYVGPMHGVKGTEPIADWDAFGDVVRQARARLG
jgi:hypothetical protein